MRKPSTDFGKTIQIICIRRTFRRDRPIARDTIIDTILSTREDSSL